MATSASKTNPGLLNAELPIVEVYPANDVIAVVRWGEGGAQHGVFFSQLMMTDTLPHRGYIFCPICSRHTRTPQGPRLYQGQQMLVMLMVSFSGS